MYNYHYRLNKSSIDFSCFYNYNEKEKIIFLKIVLNFLFKCFTVFINCITMLTVFTDFGELTELTSIEGEATANNRKAKLIFFYEWVLKGEWSGM